MPTPHDNPKPHSRPHAAKPTTLPNFNPTGSKDVAHIKGTIEPLIQYLLDMDGDARCKALAITRLEEASMWANKALFVGQENVKTADAPNPEPTQ